MWAYCPFNKIHFLKWIIFYKYIENGTLLTPLGARPFLKGGEDGEQMGGGEREKVREERGQTVVGI